MDQFVLIIAAFIFISPLQGEIQKVLVHWKGISCNTTCVQMLEQQFRKTPGVAGLVMNPQLQTAELRWMPTTPFTYQAVKFAMQSVGPGIEDLRVKVRGTIQAQNNNLWIISLGDNTPFLLLGPTAAQPGGMTQYYSYTYHPLSAAMQAQLLQGAREGRVAIIEGQLYFPDRSPPLMLIITNMQFVQPELHGVQQ